MDEYFINVFKISAPFSLEEPPGPWSRQHKRFRSKPDMAQNSSPLIEYTKHYDGISFNVRYSYHKNRLGKLSFAAQPLESYNERGYDHDFLFGQIEGEMHLQIGFKDFIFPMTKDFHERLGILYDKIREEYVEHANLLL